MDCLSIIVIVLLFLCLHGYVRESMSGNEKIEGWSLRKPKIPKSVWNIKAVQKKTMDAVKRSINQAKASKEAAKRNAARLKAEADDKERKRKELIKIAVKKRRVDVERTERHKQFKLAEEKRKKLAAEIHQKNKERARLQELERKRAISQTPVGTRPSSLPPSMQPDNVRRSTRKKIGETPKKPSKKALIKGAQQYRGKGTKDIGVYSKSGLDKHEGKVKFSKKKMEAAGITDAIANTGKGEKKRRSGSESKKDTAIVSENVPTSISVDKYVDAVPIARKVVNIPIMRSRTDATYNYLFDYNNPGSNPAPENQLSYTSPYRLKDEGFNPHDAIIV